MFVPKFKQLSLQLSGAGKSSNSCVEVATWLEERSRADSSQQLQRTLIISMDARPVMEAVVVAIAGMIFPAIILH